MLTTLGRIIGLTAVGAVLLGPLATSALAGGDVFRSAMTLSAGVDPSLSAACLASGVGRWDGTTVRIALADLDPARFPAGFGCTTTVKLAKLVVKGIALVAGPADCDPALTTTSLDFRITRPVKIGTKFSAKVSCTVAGHLNTTTWTGIF